MYFIPEVAKCESRSGSFFIGQLTTILLPAPLHPGVLQTAQRLADELQKVSSIRPRIVTGTSPVVGSSLRVEIVPELGGNQHYTCEVSADGVDIKASDAAGAFYGLQTVRQILRASGAIWGAQFIDDQPKFLHRGFYHDATRSKVPTLATLKALVDKLAYYKINQLQLYVEHTFAFARHADIASGVDPLTAEEILELDRYCQENFVELVPSLSTFGHFYMTLRCPRYEDLNELDVKGSELPFSYYDRMAHYTLDCQNPHSFELVREMLEEFIPLFSSKYFNICCDETFDLGKGKNQELAEKVGKGKLYFDFLKKVMGVVDQAGKTPMFWGDVILQDPELIKELPAGTIALDWDYSIAVQRNDTAKFQQAGVPFYVCPGVNGWNKCVPDINVATKNILNYAKKGANLGAIGLLNTDWGDYGHINLLGTSYHGLALGAAAGWNPEAAQDWVAFDRAWEVQELGLTESGFVDLWRQFSRSTVVPWNFLERRFDPALAPDAPILKNDSANFAGKLPEAVATLRKLLVQLTATLAFADPWDKLIVREFLVGFRGALAMHEAMQVLEGSASRSPHAIADDLRRYEADLSELWLKRNKLGEYGYFRDKIREIANELERRGSKFGEN